MTLKGNVQERAGSDTDISRVHISQRVVLVHMLLLNNNKKSCTALLHLILSDLERSSSISLISNPYVLERNRAMAYETFENRPVCQ